MRELLKQNTRPLIIIIVILLAIIIVWSVLGARPTITQPIEYNHKIHIEEAELTCIDCHITVESMPAATLPNIEVCQDCHSDEPLSDSPEEIKLLKYISEDQQIPWQRIYSVPDHVYFSHRRHVTIGELECTNCHGNVEKLTKPASYPLWLPLMDNCIACHKKHKVTYDCLACHR